MNNFSTFPQADTMSEITVYDDQARGLASAERMHQAGQAANRAAAAGVFEDYQSRKAENTRRRQRADLACFADFLRAPSLQPGDLENDPGAWQGITWGIVEAFKKWMLGEGLAIGTINFRLSTVRTYAGLADAAGTLAPGELENINSRVKGYKTGERENVDKAREAEAIPTRAGAKKAEAVSITPAQAKQLKTQPDTPQGRRDAVIMAILLDHGLRCGELAGLTVDNIDLEAETITFDRPKVHKRQTHKMTCASRRALAAYLENDQPMLSGALLLATRKGGHRGEGGGKLAGVGMTERAITERVRYLGALIGLEGLSAHDCRHYWATDAARNKTPLDRLKDAGGWSSYAMPLRYIEAAKIANEGVNLSSD